MRQIGAIAAVLLLSACAGRIVPQGAALPPVHPAPPIRLEPPAAQPTPATPLPPQSIVTTPKGPNARSTGVSAGTPLESLPLDDAHAVRALIAFRASCSALQRRADASGLTQPNDWQSACAAAATTPDSGARGFFLSSFETAQIGSGAAFATGYFIPEIAASRTVSADYRTPIYQRPTDEIDVDLGLFSDSLKGKMIHGHVVHVPIATGTQDRFLPYPERAQISGGALPDAPPIIAYAQDPVAFFFLQVQGSGILRFPDGRTTRIGYAGQNGHDYTGIGSVMKAQKLFADGAYSYQNITNYLRSHPDQATGIMNTNKSFVFFRELPTPVFQAQWAWR